MDAPASAAGPPGRTRDLTEGPIARTLAVFALPVLGSSVLQSLNASINAVWVGRFLGEAALAATSNANLVLFLMLGTIFGVGMAATIMIGQTMGRRDTDLARRVVGSSAAFFFGISVLFALGGWLGTGSILAAMGTPPDALPLASAYLKVIFLAFPFMNFMTFLMTVLRGAGDSRTPFVFMGLSVVLDIAFNPVLILGLGPFPRLGIAGAAWATLISQLVSFTALMVLLYARKHPLRLAGPDLAYLRPDPALLRTLVAKGLPMGLQMIVISASALVTMSLVNSFGSRTAAAYGVAAQLWTYVQMPSMAVGAAVSSMAAQNIGADRWDRVSRITRSGIVFNILFTGVMVSVLYVVGGSVMGLFLPTDSAAVAIAVHINQLVVWTFIPFGVTIILFATVRANGDVWPPLVIFSLSIVGVRLPFAYGLVGVWGPDAVWWSFPFGSAVALALSIAYYRTGRWKKAHMLAGDRPAMGEPPDTGQGLPRERAQIHEGQIHEGMEPVSLSPPPLEQLGDPGEPESPGSPPAPKAPRSETV
jgi:putative MATE family efflux protein